MNKIVRHNYPIGYLPEDLRKDLPETGTVSIRIEVETPRVRLADFVGSMPNVHGSPTETVDHLRRGRDET
jgi:hypothetical protein